MVDEPTHIEYDKSSITIVHGEQNQTMTGTIESDSCSWKTPYSEGKSTIKAVMTDPQGAIRNLTITIEGKDGKILLHAESEERPDRKIRIVIDKFEEKK